MDTISARIFRLLKKEGKTQKDLAKHIGVRQATVSSWRQQRATPSTEMLQSISEFLGVSIDYIVTGQYYRTTSLSLDDGQLSDIVCELVRICDTLDMRRKNALLTYAYNLEKEMPEVNTI